MVASTFHGSGRYSGSGVCGVSRPPRLHGRSSRMTPAIQNTNLTKTTRVNKWRKGGGIAGKGGLLGGKTKCTSTNALVIMEESDSDDEDWPEPSFADDQEHFSLLPCDRAQGKGWRIMAQDNSKSTDWGIMGCDSDSIFLYIHSKNRDEHTRRTRETAKNETDEPKAGRTTPRCSSVTSCASEANSVTKNTLVRSSSSLSVLADELAMAAAVC